MRFPNIHLLKIYNSKIGNVQLFKGDPPPPKKKAHGENKTEIPYTCLEKNIYCTNKNRDDTINLLDNIFRLEVQRRERGRILQRHM